MRQAAWDGTVEDAVPACAASVAPAPRTASRTSPPQDLAYARTPSMCGRLPVVVLAATPAT